MSNNSCATPSGGRAYLIIMGAQTSLDLMCQPREASLDDPGPKFVGKPLGNVGIPDAF